MNARRLTGSLLFPALLLLGLIGTRPAAAAISTFSGMDAGAGPTDPRPNSNAAAASYDAAVGTSPIIDFESAPLGNFASLSVAPGVQVSLSGTASDASAGITTAANTVLGYNTTSGGSQYLRIVPQFGSDGLVTFNFAAPIHAFGAYFTGVEPTFGTLDLLFNDGSPQDLSIVSNPDSGVLFFGFTDPGSEINQLVIRDSTINPNLRDILGVDDIRYSEVPEPSSCALLAGGVLGLIGKLRRRRAG